MSTSKLRFFGLLLELVHSKELLFNMSLEKCFLVSLHGSDCLVVKYQMFLHKDIQVLDIFLSFPENAFENLIALN